MATREEARQAREAKLDELHDKLTGAVERLVTGENWADALRFAARFRSRSFNNVLLIWEQHQAAFEQGRVPEPFPTYVAGYKQWQQVGRQVEKGQAGYQILAPVTGRFASTNPSDPASWRRLNRGEKPKPGETVRSKMVGVRPAYVWDVSQTTGDPLPTKPEPRLLTGEAPEGLREGLAERIEAEGFELLWVPHEGMTQKATTGGTNGKAPIGYLNTTRRDELGREVRTIEVDPKRGPLIKWAFEAYATGTYSTATLRDELIDRGLTTVPTPKRPEKAPGLSSIQQMLANPYYKGNVVFKGATYDGLHEPLVAPEVWYRVQTVLDAHRVSGEKTQAHDHYLKGTVFCGTCGSRLILSNAKSSTGVIYPYFLCSGRHSKRTACDRKAMYVPDIEAAVEDYYRMVEIPEHILGPLRTLIHAEFDRLYATAKTERKAQIVERDRLHDERTKLLQAHYAGAVPLDLLKSEQERIARQVAFLDSRIEASSVEYEQARAHLDDCLALAGDAHKVYMSVDDSLRRIANQAFFERLTVADDNGIDGEPGTPFNILFDQDVQATALAAQAAGGVQAAQTGNVARLNDDLLVGDSRLELLTSSV